MSNKSRHLDYDSNPTVPYDTTGLKPEAFDRSEKAWDKKIAPAIFDCCT
ncbi:MAG: hypothetical protein HF976_08465 [ANME-2 cluster archaeon]|nr:hypothetical protein [ANME-2 cluster archaeon]MBC2701429.1 hypothetical protein [ANME-2 cluster archaeon]MBC2706982.1 hypothetical protein [ANME-2 cluster archaeon]MBC2746044.1 hypothetical protein [ANME-2 cluster archaeon]